MERGWERLATSMCGPGSITEASETYLEQCSRLRAGKGSGDTAGRWPTIRRSCPPGLDVLFRIQALGDMIGSLEQGNAQYQTPADAAALALYPRERRQPLAPRGTWSISPRIREQQLQVMDSEAQRCRALLTAPRPAARKR